MAAAIGRAGGSTLTGKPLTKSPPKGSPPDPSAEQNRMASWVKMVQQGAATQYYSLHRQWALNKAMRIGQQYAMWSDSSKSLVVNKKVPRHRVRMSVNVVHPVITSLSAMLLKTKPVPVVMPSTSEQKDKDSAKVAEKVIEFEWAGNSMDHKSIQLANEMFESGSAFAKVMWDPDSGPVVEATDSDENPLIDPGTGMPMIDADGSPLRFMIGRTSIEVVPPYQILPDPNASTLDDMTWVVHTRMRSLGWIREHYPWGKWVTSEPSTGYNTLEHQFNRYTAGNMASNFPTTPESSEWARVNEAWIKPGTKVRGKIYPQGALVIQCQGHCTIQSNPYMDAVGANPEEDWHPFVMFRAYEVGRFWPMGAIDNLAPIQRELNKVYSSIIESQRLMSRPKWIIPSTSGISKNALTSEPGEKIEYNASAGPPRPIEMPSMPSYVFGLLEKLHEDVDFVSGNHGPSRGQATGGVRSGIGLALLQEQDALDMGVLTINWEHSMSRLGRMILMRVHQYWDIDRLVTVVGNNQQVEAFHFNSADLGNNFDVQVQAGSGLPKSKAAQQALVEKLIQLGIFNPMVPEHRRLILNMLELGVGDEPYLNVNADVRRADQENELMMRTVQPEVRWYDDHQVHIQKHLNFMKSDEYLEATAQDPELGAIFNMHVSVHANPQMIEMMPMTNPGTFMNPMMQGVPPGTEPGQPPQAGGTGGETMNATAGGMMSPQSPQANREQTMGGMGGSQQNPSMGM